MTIILCEVSDDRPQEEDCHCDRSTFINDSPKGNYCYLNSDYVCSTDTKTGKIYNVFYYW